MFHRAPEDALVPLGQCLGAVAPASFAVTSVAVAGRRTAPHRAVATRYGKRAYIYLGTVTLAALLIWLRT